MMCQSLFYELYIHQFTSNIQVLLFSCHLIKKSCGNNLSLATQILNRMNHVFNPGSIPQMTVLITKIISFFMWFYFLSCQALVFKVFARVLGVCDNVFQVIKENKSRLGSGASTNQSNFTTSVLTLMMQIKNL